jgi:Gas vesicle synthesis protein GvpL/GvpF
MLEDPPTLMSSTLARQQTTGELLWGYAILPFGEWEPMPVSGIDADSPVYTLVSGNLQVVVSRVRAEQFNPATTEAALQDMEWVATHVRAHQRVLDHLVASGHSVLPMRFCTIYYDEAAVHAVLEKHAPSLRAELDRLHHKHEWGVKLFTDIEELQIAILARHIALESWIRHSELEAVQARVAAMSIGGAFLFKKKQDAVVAELTNDIAFAVADNSHRRLSDYAIEAILNPLPRQRPKIQLNAAYLVAKASFNRFHSEFERLGEQYQGIGVRYELSGPWPAYNFINVNLNS